MRTSMNGIGTLKRFLPGANEPECEQGCKLKLVPHNPHHEPRVVHRVSVCPGKLFVGVKDVQIDFPLALGLTFPSDDVFATRGRRIILCIIHLQLEGADLVRKIT
jgi:hypothetical protein